MKLRLLLVCLLAGAASISNAQYWTQYFDGADTIVGSSVFIDIDPDTTNIWQIGPPQKTVFTMAATAPNVIVTDTVNPYPINNISRFSFDVDPSAFQWGIVALQWTQMLDFDDNDGGIVEYSVDGGTTWANVFNNPFVYNLYGHDISNEVVLPTGEDAFGGKDSTWKDIWLCFDWSWISQQSSMTVRYTMKSDSVTPGASLGSDGWMIDNLIVHITFMHTVAEALQEDYMLVYPTPTTGEVKILTQKVQGFHLIEQMELIDLEGRVVKSWASVPTKFMIDISDQPDGLYHLRVQTNIRTKVVPVMLNKNR